MTGGRRRSSGWKRRRHTERRPEPPLSAGDSGYAVCLVGVCGRAACWRREAEVERRRWCWGEGGGVVGDAGGCRFKVPKMITVKVRHGVDDVIWRTASRVRDKNLNRDQRSFEHIIWFPMRGQLSLEFERVVRGGAIRRTEQDTRGPKNSSEA
ncbi:hypothetical protein HZH66_015343 [Vespula vulgaris]|uniref:Uncharacterized protein n=1 Tax=Vespula vulgaris TaxID=7454 RepID=A0A834J3Z4_VESVU|nr:hypothetical protein HZH66_015343 [Vespula vulgaris]